MEVFLVYLWLKLGTMIGMLGFVGFFLSFGCWIVYCMGKDSCYQKEEKQIFADKWWKKTKTAIITGFVCLFLANALPDPKEMAILVGTSYAVDFAKSPEGAKIGVLIRKKANDYLDEQIKEITPPAAKAGNPE